MSMISMSETALAVCRWKIERETVVKTDCGRTTNIYDDNPSGWNYCPYCGMRIKVVEIEDNEAEGLSSKRGEEA